MTVCYKWFFLYERNRLFEIYFFKAANYLNEYGLDCGAKNGSSACFKKRVSKNVN